MGMNHAYGAPADKTEMINLIAQAVDMGYTFFDTVLATKEYLRRAHAVCPVNAIQNRYSMMARWHGWLIKIHILFQFRGQENWNV